MSKNIVAGCVVSTKFVTSGSDIFSGYIDYIDRENAVRNDHIYSYSLYANYMDNPEKTTDLFTASSNHLTDQEKQDYKAIYEKAQKNGSPMWQTVISFDNRWLEENGLYNSSDGFLDVKKLMTYTRFAVNDMLKAENLDNAVWTAAVHYNTDNLHIHIATVEPVPTREMVNVKTIRFPSDWVKENNIIRGETITPNKKVAAHKDKNYGYRNIYNRITDLLTAQAYNTRLLGDYIAINANGSIDLSYRGDNALIPGMAKLIDEHMEIKGTFKESSIKRCKSKMINQVIGHSLNNSKLNEIMRKNIAASMRNNVLLEDKEIVRKFLSVYNKLPVQRNDWKYGMNKIAHLRPELDKITEMYLNKYMPDEFAQFKTLLNKQGQLYKEAYGGDADVKRITSQINELFKRCGNAILSQMKEMSLRDIHELESSSYISAEIDEAAATNEPIDFDGRISYKSDSDKNKSKYWTEAFKAARKDLAAVLKLENSAEKATALESVLNVFMSEVANGNDVAAYELGRCYKLGTFGDIDINLSQKYFEIAFNGFLNELNSDSWLENMIAFSDFRHYNPNATKAEYDKALREFTKNAERDEWLQNYLNYRVGRMLIDGIGTDKNVTEGISYLEQSTSPFAYYTLGNFYYYGNEVEQNYEQAYEYFSLAGFPEDEISMPFAVYNMAEMLEKGLVQDERLDKDYLYTKALSEFIASENNEPNDLIEYKIATMMLSGKGCKINEKAAEEYLLKSAVYGNTFAQTKLANLYIKSENPELAGRAIFLLQLAAETNNAMAQYQLGKIRIDEKSEYFNLDEGLELLKKSAEQDNEYAQYTLGTIYMNGEIVEQNTTIAIDYLNKSADQGNQFAQFQLGKIYYSEKFGLKDIYQAMTYFHKSAEQGNQFAQYQLGVIYYKGDDIEQNEELALKYLELSAQQNNQFAQYTLGIIYLKGEITETDINKSIEFFELSADQDNQFAQYQLGKLYYFGTEGIEKDIDKALEYLNRSAEQGNEYAISLLNWRLTPYSHSRGMEFSESMISFSSDMRQLFEMLSNEHDHMLNQMAYQNIEREKAKDDKAILQ